MVPWKVLDTVATPAGSLQLRQRNPREFLITIEGRVLMTSTERSSENAAATLACAEIGKRKAPRMLIGGLGMAYTLRAALDALPPTAHVTVAEITPQVAEWCRGPLAPLTRGAVLDPRVRVQVGDVARIIAGARAGSLDAIVLDIYEGPRESAKYPDDPFYGRAALDRTLAALSPGGVLTVWAEALDTVFKRRMIDAGLETTVHHPGASRAYVVYVGRKRSRA